MARNNAPKIELTAYDDLFQTDESRAEAALSKIRDIPISEIDEFPDHPFKVLMDEDMEQLVDSIKRNGVMTPATVRLKEDGRYELISGHRRKKACELAGLETLKCEVKELTRDEAIIVMVESNLQRSTILPSEKAFAYKMRLEAMKRQAGRPPKENSSPMGTHLRSDAELAEKVGESRNQIQRYIRLTELVPEILQMVDERRIAFRPAVEISYLPEEQQYTLRTARFLRAPTTTTLFLWAKTKVERPDMPPAAALWEALLRATLLAATSGIRSDFWQKSRQLRCICLKPPLIYSPMPLISNVRAGTIKKKTCSLFRVCISPRKKSRTAKCRLL